MPVVRIITLSVALSLMLPASAALPAPHRYASGTGFFINNSGDIITNEHVVSGCSEVMVRGAVRPIRARVSVVDKENDLALISADVVPPYTAFIRHISSPLKVGERLIVMGYPLDHGVSGKYKFVEATLLDDKGMLGEENFVQFSMSADHGNSGGPLLDAQGNVAGVIVSRATLRAYDPRSAREEIVKEADLAISLPVLTNFLIRNNVPYQTNSTTFDLMNHHIEDQGSDFIVNIHCEQK